MGACKVVRVAIDVGCPDGGQLAPLFFEISPGAVSCDGYQPPRFERRGGVALSWLSSSHSLPKVAFSLVPFAVDDGMIY